MALTRAQAVSRLIVALDASKRTAVVALARLLGDRTAMVKVGLEAFTAHGPDLVRELRDIPVAVFLDLKLHDIPNTVERAARNCACMGVAAFTVHASGGEAMLRAAVAGAAAGHAGATPRVVAVTVLTSLDADALSALDIPGDTSERVSRWAALARRSGCGGVVCSPQEAAALRAASGPDFLLFTPGIRPAGETLGDQKRVATPAAAVAAGADFIIVGRPITAAADPAAAADAILAELCTDL
jgi:orotidine-5'-phosphate decarboxylase